MRIGVNLLPLEPGRSGGIERYARSLVRSLAEYDSHDEFVLFTNRENHHSFGPDSPRLRRVLCPIGARPQARRAYFEQVFLPNRANRLGVDLLHSPFYTCPLRYRGPGVVTICDMLYKVYPQYVGQPRLTFWRVFVPLAARRCRKIVTISESSRRDIVRFLRVPPDKVVVTPLAVDTEFLDGERGSSGADFERLCRRYGVRQPYVLNVGGGGRHKNTGALVRAFREYLDRPSDEIALSLVITGHDYGARAGLEQLIGLLGLSERVRLLGYIPAHDLPALYRHAHLYVSTSLFEGFGLTVLEAMASGVPVVVANRAALPEIVAGSGLVVEPTDPSAIAHAIWRVATNGELRAELSRAGTGRARDFSWTRTARQTLEVYRAALGA